MTFLEAESLSRWYGEVVGLNSVSFRIEGGLVGLLGPNGAGKTTLFQLALGQLKPSSGSLRLLGENPWRNPRVLSRVGYVPETDTFWSSMTPREFVEFLGSLSGLKGGDLRRRAQESLELVQLEREAWERPIGSLSRGMRQKTKLAQALVHSPDALFLDEPLTGADPLTRRQIQEAIREYASGGSSILLSSHVLHEVEEVTSEVLVLSRGRLVALGKIEEIRALMAEHPHTLRLGVSDPRALGPRLLEDPSVVSVRIGKEGALVVETRDPQRIRRVIPSLCLERGVRLFHLSTADTGLEALFSYLFERQGGLSE